MSYSVILPTLNEKGHIIELIQNIRFIFSKISKEYEIIIIDDNSTDGTIELIRNVDRDYKNIKLFVRQGLKKNLANSINLGIEKSKYDNIIFHCSVIFFHIRNSKTCFTINLMLYTYYCFL